MIAAQQDGAVRFNIEAKLFPLRPELTVTPECFVSRLLEEVSRAGLEGRVVIQCFDWRVLGLVQKWAPRIATGALTDQQGADDTVYCGPRPIALAGRPRPRRLWRFGAEARPGERGVVWSPNYLDLSAPALIEAQELGLKVTPWTVNAPADMRRIVALGVDGMITDRPDLLRGVLQQAGVAVPAPPALS